MDKKQLWILIRFLVIIIPVIFAFFVLFNPLEKIPLSREKITEDSTVVKVSEDVIFQPSLKNAIRDIFDVPFDLRWYEICFVNKDTKLIYENGETDKNVNVTLNFNNNQTIFTVPYGETKCVLYKFNKDFTYYWGFEYSIDLGRVLETSKEKFIPINETHYIRQRGTYSLHPDVGSYAKPEMSSIIVKNILFFFAWSGIVLMSLEIIDFIRFGHKKKK